MYHHAEVMPMFWRVLGLFLIGVGVLGMLSGVLALASNGTAAIIALAFSAILVIAGARVRMIGAQG